MAGSGTHSPTDKVYKITKKWDIDDRFEQKYPKIVIAMIRKKIQTKKLCWTYMLEQQLIKLCNLYGLIVVKFDKMKRNFW